MDKKKTDRKKSPEKEKVEEQKPNRKKSPVKNQEEDKKSRLKTSEEILHRLKWDSSFCAEGCVIGYEDRFVGIIEMPMLLFETSGIPFHRVQYFKLGKQLIWDRASRLDLVTGRSHELEGEPSSSTRRSPTGNEYEEGAERNEEGGSAAGASSSGAPPVMVMGRTWDPFVEQYQPEDALEKWLLAHSKMGLAAEFPTHTSQAGGRYHIPDDLRHGFFAAWSQALASEQPFFIEEVRTEVYRLYLDIDVKRTAAAQQPFDLVGSGWLDVIVREAATFFRRFAESSQPVDLGFVLTDCHGRWTDTRNRTAAFKSGFRIYFNALFVDAGTHGEFARQLTSSLEALFGPQAYAGQPEDWSWRDLIDADVERNKRARLVGSCKLRRGKNLGRRYGLVGSFVALEDGQISLEPHRTSALQTDAIQFLQSTYVSIWDTRDLGSSVVMATQARAIALSEPAPALSSAPDIMAVEPIVYPTGDPLHRIVELVHQQMSPELLLFKELFPHIVRASAQVRRPKHDLPKAGVPNRTGSDDGWQQVKSRAPPPPCGRGSAIPSGGRGGGVPAGRGGPPPNPSAEHVARRLGEYVSRSRNGQDMSHLPEPGWWPGFGSFLIA